MSAIINIRRKVLQVFRFAQSTRLFKVLPQLLLSYLFVAMAGRGRGRGPPGGLKGATWEYDPTLKLDGKPNDLFPVCPSLPWIS